MRCLRNMQKKRLSPQWVFLIVMSAALVLFAAAVLFTRGEALQRILCPDPNDTFMDYFNCLVPLGIPGFGVDPYPAMARLIFRFLGRTVPTDVYHAYDFYNRYVIRGTQLGLITIFLVVIAVLGTLHTAFSDMIHGSAMKKTLGFYCLIFSEPFIFLLERGNIMLLSVALCMVFAWGYDSEKRIIRYVSFLALAIAAAIKIYPAVLGFLLIRERRWKDAVILAVMGLMAFFLPYFLWYDGVSGILQYLQTLTQFVQSHEGGVYLIGRNDLRAIFDTLTIFTGINFHFIPTILRFGLFFACVLVACCPKVPRWKAALLLTSIMVFFSIGATYVLTFLSIPLAFFMKEEKETPRTAVHYFYAFLFALIFAPLYLPVSLPLSLPQPVCDIRFLHTVIRDVGLYGMIIVIFLEQLVSLLKKFQFRRSL